MKRLLSTLYGLVLMAVPSLALANVPGGGYEGIASMYYSLIAIILIYGVYDTFGKKAMYVATPIIVLLAYFLVQGAHP